MRTKEVLEKIDIPRDRLYYLVVCYINAVNNIAFLNTCAILFLESIKFSKRRKIWHEKLEKSLYQKRKEQI